MSKETQSGRRRILKLSGSAVASSLGLSAFSASGVASSDTDSTDGDDVARDGNKRLDPGPGGSGGIDQSNWADYNYHMDITINNPVASIPNPGSFGVEVCADFQGGRICFSKDAIVEYGQPPCSNAPLMYWTSWSAAEEEFKQDGTTITVTAWDFWLGWNPATLCYWIGDEYSCKQINCPPQTYPDPWYMNTPEVESDMESAGPDAVEWLDDEAATAIAAGTLATAMGGGLARVRAEGQTA